MIPAFEGEPARSGGQVYKFFLSLRFLRSRIISYLAVLFTMLGVTILVIVQCIMGGFEDEMRASLRSFHSHITVESKIYHNVRSGEKVMEKVRAVPGVADCAPYAEVPVMISGITHDYGFLRGVNPEQEVRVSEIGDLLLSERDVGRDIFLEPDWGDHPDWPEMFAEDLKLYPDDRNLTTMLENTRTYLPGIIVGAEITDRFRLIPVPKGSGDKPPIITLFTARAENISEDTVEPEKQSFEVVGAFRTGNYEIDRRFLYCLVEDAQEFIGLESNQLSGISVKVDDFDDVDRIKALISPIAAEYPDETLRVMTWKDHNKALLQAVRLEKWLITVIILSILTLVSALIVAILTMSVVEKTRDIGILRSLGGTGAGIMTIFLAQGVVIGGAGGAAGLAVGLLMVKFRNGIANGIEKLTGYHPFPPDIYYLDSIPARVDGAELTTLVAIVLTISFVLSLFPAARAVRVNTIRALRYE